MRDLTLTEIERLRAEEADAAVPLEMDEESFRGFYDRTARTLRAYLARVTGDGALADDLLQEAYYRFLRARGEYEGEAHRRNTLFRIATNLIHDSRRRARVAPLIATRTTKSPIGETRRRPPNAPPTCGGRWRTSSRVNGRCSGWPTPRARRTRRLPNRSACAPAASSCCCSAPGAGWPALLTGSRAAEQERSGL